MYAVNGAISRSDAKVMVLLPLDQSRQLTVISVTVAAVSASTPFAFVVALPAPVHAVVTHGCVLFVDAVRACFPSTQPNPVLSSLDSPLSDDDDDSVDNGEHGGSSVSKSAGAPASSSTASTAGPDARTSVSLPGPKVLEAQALRSLLGTRADPIIHHYELESRSRHGRRPFAFVVAEGPAGCAHRFCLGIIHPLAGPNHLWAPTWTGASGPSMATATAPTVSEEDAPPVPWNADIFSVGTARIGGWEGGGKTPEEAEKDIRYRHAVGSFRSLTVPTRKWTDVFASASLAPPEVRAVYAGERGIVTDLDGVQWPGLPSSSSAAPGAAAAGASGPGTDRGMPWVACMRHKKVALGPDTDTLLRLDDGNIPRGMYS